MTKHRLKILVSACALTCLALLLPSLSQGVWPLGKKAEKLYWFIPDGTRAEPDMFTVFKWAEEGKLPNIKKMMDNGAYGYSIPDFPSHTPTNFASLLTGAHPRVHGISDGPMHVEARRSRGRLSEAFPRQPRRSRQYGRSWRTRAKRSRFFQYRAQPHLSLTMALP